MTIKHLFPLALLAGLHAPAALASADMTCTPSWKLISDDFSTCNNLAFLSPGNDSRVNLQLLLDDAGYLHLNREPQAIDGYEYGYGRVPFSLGMLDPGRQETPPSDVDGQPAPDPDVTYLSEALQRLGIPSEASTFAVQQFADGEGNRCRSNDLPAVRGFIDALDATPQLAASEAQALARSRLNLLSLCGEGDPQPQDILPSATQLQSAASQDFGHYLSGADAFYRGDLDAAQQSFSALTDNQQPWLRETAHYLLGRVALNQAQLNAFDEYGFFSPEQVDKTHLASSEKAFEQYLQSYPQGLYSDSARGLLRRVYWLAGDTRRFAQAFADAFSQRPQPTDLHALIEELDGKLLPSLAPEAVEDPLLLAMVDLIRLRNPGSEPPRISLEELQAQQPRFASQPDLHAYLMAAWHFYRGGNAEQALAALPEASSGPMNVLVFSQETLRGLAMEAKGNLPDAQQHWLALLARSEDPLQQAQLQLALALNYERSGQLDKVFAAHSPITTAPIRERLLAYGAGADLLRQRADSEQAAPGERETALYTLLYRDLNDGLYADFLRDVARLPYKPAQPPQQFDPNLFAWAGGNDAGYACPALTKVVERLAANAEDAQGLLCLGDFIRVNGLDGHSLDQPPRAGELGSAPSQFQGSPHSRLAGYQTLMKAPQASRDDKAYALFRAINCYAPSGYNGCDAQDIAKSERKQWFQTLKRQYADTPWAQQLKYYW